MVCWRIQNGAEAEPACLEDCREDDDKKIELFEMYYRADTGGDMKLSFDQGKAKGARAQEEAKAV